MQDVWFLGKWILKTHPFGRQILWLNIGEYPLGSKVDEILGFTIFFSRCCENLFILPWFWDLFYFDPKFWAEKPPPFPDISVFHFRDFGIFQIFCRYFGIFHIFRRYFGVLVFFQKFTFFDYFPIFWDSTPSITTYIERRVRTRLLGWGLVVHTLYRVK